jgi:pimeloyl-ACP methyl ester carboxylesterase
MAGLTVASVLSLLVLLALAGAAYELIASSRDAQRYPAPGQLVDIGGRRLHLDCVGSGSPTVVLEAGGGGTSLDWSLVQPALAGTAKVCAYDRAGSGWSDPGPMPRSPERIVEDLFAVLGAGQVGGPYVLVSHSDSGLATQLFATEHPDLVAGIVFVDARHMESISSAERQRNLDQARTLPTITTLVGRSGVGRLFGADLFPQIHPEGRFLPPATRELMLLQASRPAYVEQVISSVESATANDAELASAPSGSLGSTPIVVLTTEQYTTLYPGWRAGQDELARLSTNAVHRFVGPGSEHYVAWQQPEMVIAAVNQVVDSARTAIPLTE